MDRTVTKSLVVKLTPEEVNEYARRVAEKCLRAQSLEEEKVSHAKSIKGLIDGLSSEMRDLSSRVRKGEELRDVECQWSYRWTEGVKHLVRTDTWEIVQTDPIEAHERQRRLELERETFGNAERGGETPDPEDTGEPSEGDTPAGEIGEAEHRRRGGRK